MIDTEVPSGLTSLASLLTPLSSQTFERARAMIYDYAGIALDESKETMVSGRLARLARTSDAESVESLLDLAQKDAQHRQAFINALTTNLTAFFREPHHFEILTHFLRTRRQPVSIWCAAASSGEEAYSLALAALGALGDSAAAVQILATDIDTDQLALAQAGIYSAKQVRPLQASLLRRYFLKGTGSNEGLFKVGPALRSMVHFAPFNLAMPRWPEAQRHDAIFCRNAMIYFDRATQAAVLKRLLQRLHDNGLLFAGHTEQLNLLAPGLVVRGRTVFSKGGVPLAKQEFT